MTLRSTKTSQGLRLRFLGAAGTVTGSRYLVEASSKRVLVDCGLFQGWKGLRERNWADFPIPPASIDAVVLTHAHLDHSGYLPKLCRDGFSGPIFCTEGTRDLLEILLPDSARLQEEQAKHANKHGYSKHLPAQPLYTEAEAASCLKKIRTVPYYEDFQPVQGFEARFTRAGHILGSASLTLRAQNRTILFSGDVGRPSDPVMKPADAPPPADYLVIESTYGDRIHPQEDVYAALKKLVNETVERKSALVIPAFAVGRVQHLLHILAELRSNNQIPAIPTFLNSPMGISATECFLKHPEDHKLNKEECHAFSKGVTFVHKVEDSKALDEKKGPLILIAGSGMATGGRVLHHFVRYLPDPAATILFVGYQAPGTRGYSMVSGSTEVKLQGRYIPVKARIAQIEGLSAHADYVELLQWIKAGDIKPRKVFVTHGESAAADALRRRIQETGMTAIVPEDGDSFDLE